MIPPTAPKGRIENMKNRRLICFLAALVLALSCLASASALSSSTLSIGSRGEEVRRLQKRLDELGFEPGTADGVYGNATYLAVLLFQSRNGLEMDGAAGEETQKLLYSDNAAGKFKTPFDAPGVMERLLDGVASETIQKYAKHAASTLALFFMIYIANHPQEAENQDFLEYIVDRITSFFTA